MVDSPSHRDPSSRSVSPSRLGRLFVGLQCRATIFILGVTFVVTLSACGYLLRVNTRLAIQERQRHATQVARLMAACATPYLFDVNLVELNALAGRFMTDDSVLFVRFLTQERQILVDRRHPGRAAPATPPSALEPDLLLVGVPQFHPPPSDDPDQGGAVTIFHPIASSTDLARKNLLGYVHIGLSMENWRQSWALIIDWMIGVGLIVLAVGIPLSFGVVRRIVVPINKLAQAMSAFSSGYLGVRSKVRRHDEIGRLASVFNRMADQHQMAHEKLMKLNKELEKRVERRTRLLQHQANRDPLTGLYNRRYFDEVLQKRFAETRRYGNSLSILMVDVDNFKQVNDRHGHQTGDRLLKQLASIIKNQLRIADVAARFGGDEFIILLPQTDARQARALAQRLCARFHQLPSASHLSASITLSVGLADSGDLKPETPDHLILYADNALYQAKGEGKNRIVSASHDSNVLNSPNL